MVAALVVDSFTAELHLIEVARHAEAEQKILQAVRQFWTNFDANIQPALDPDKDHDLVKAMFPKENGSTIDLSADNRLPGLMDERALLAKQGTAMDNRRKQIDTEVKDKMGVASYARIAGNRMLSCNEQTRTTKPSTSTFRVLREIKAR